MDRELLRTRVYITTHLFWDVHLSSNGLSSDQCLVVFVFVFFLPSSLFVVVILLYVNVFL